MFEFGRELRRILGGQDAYAPPRDGMTGGDAGLLELLDLELLLTEAKAADVAAGRVGIRDRAERQLQQAAIWREVARRTGDAAVLRKAASAAELSANGFERKQDWALARTEQAACASLGADLYGDDGLRAAAGVALADAIASGGKAGVMLATAHQAGLDVAAAITGGDHAAFTRAMSRFDTPLALGVGGRGRSGQLELAALRADRAEALIDAGVRFRDDRLFSRAINEMDKLQAGLDPAYEPLTYARVLGLRGRALVRLGETIGEAAHIIDGVARLTEVFDLLTRDHSPLDWARAQLALADGLQLVGEATDSDEAFDQAVAAFDRALVVLRRQPTLPLRAEAGVNRALCLARRAELSLDLYALDEAEAAFRCQLAAAQPRKDPVAWAVCQMGLARIYEARLDITGRDDGERAKAAMALSAAIDVFSENGLRSLTDLADQALKRLRVPVPHDRH